MSRLPDDAASQLVEQYRSGQSIRSLATEFGIHRTTVHAHLDRAGVNRSASKPALSEAQVDEAVELYQDGWSWLRIARHFEVSDCTIGKALRRRGVEMRPRKGGRS